jgi:hypothetical protein
MRRRLLAAALLAVGVAVPAGGCGIAASEPISFGPAPRARLTITQVYFVRNGRLHPVAREMPAPSRPAAREPATSPAPATPVIDPPRAALDLLLTGPSPSESGAGLTSEVPPEIRMFTKGPSDGEISLFLLSPVPNAGPPLSDLAYAQITCTAVAAFSHTPTTVERVTFRDRGGRATHGPLTCPMPLPQRQVP